MPSEKMLLIVAYGVRNVSLQYLVDYNTVLGKILTRFSLNTRIRTAAPSAARSGIV